MQKQERQRFFRKIRWFEEVIGEDLPVIIDKQIIFTTNDLDAPPSGKSNFTKKDGDDEPNKCPQQ